MTTGTDPTTAEWLVALGSASRSDHDGAVRRLHELLARVAHAEARRRVGVHGLSGQELDDLAEQAANDAVVSVLRRLEDFRGESRFTTWACKFVILELSSKVGRHVWRRHGPAPDEARWDQLPARWGEQPHEVSQSRELLAAVRDFVERGLTEHQRAVFVAIVVNGTPLDALTAQLDTSRNAIYKTLFDARRKLRRHLVDSGHVDGARWDRAGRGQA